MLPAFIMQQATPTQTNIIKKIAASTGVVAVVFTALKVLGFIEKLLLADYFGTGPEVDAYIAAFTLMIVFWDILRGLLAPAYLPTLVEYRAEVGDEQSWEFTVTVLNLFSLIFAALIGAALFAAPQLVRLVAPGFAGEQLTIAIGMTRLMLTGAGFFAIALITGFTLDSYKRFFLAVTDDIVFKVAGLVGLVALGGYVGIYGLGWGIALGSWLAPFIHLVALRRYLHHYRLRINLNMPPARKMFRLMLPMLVGTVCIEGRRLVDNFFASLFGVGSVASLAFGYKLIEFAYAAVAKPLSVVTLPYFSDLALQKDHANLQETLMTTLRTVILIFTPLALCLFALRLPVVQMLFQHGEFDAESTRLTVMAVSFYAFGLIAFGVDTILLRAYFSLGDTITPAIMEVATILLHVGIILLGRNALGHGSIALAFTVSKSVKVCLLFGLLHRKNMVLHLPENLRFLGKISLAAVGMIALITVYDRLFSAILPPDGFVPQAILISSSGALGLAAFFGAALLLNVQEMRQVVRAVAVFVSHNMKRAFKKSAF